ncbi:MAG TPA: NADH-quinone oxidoreductase subunit J [Anaerolineae bacterium]|nr:NADH-quinone oxidoreductase subunit J [Anaerolineae bacterium]
MPTDIILFIILAAIAIVCAIAMIVTRNAIHSALFLVVVMAVLAIFFLGLGGPFIAMVQVAVYAGAIMVLFLFVVMLLGAERVGARSGLRWQVPVALALGVILLVIVGLLLFGVAPRGMVDLPSLQNFGAVIPEACADDVAQVQATDLAQGTPCLIGDRLFTTYLFPFEVVSILLLVAMVGAVVLTRRPRESAQ